MRVRRTAVLLCGAFVLAAAACTPQGGGSTNVAPIASFTASPTSGNAALLVNFDATDSSDSDGTVASYSWTFGDGGVDSGVTVSHTYVAGGTFVATLTVTDNAAATNSISKTITVTGDGDGDLYFPPSDCNDADASIHPGAVDVAGDSIDQNCDGIDGTITNAIFVNSSSGSDTITCGTIAAPCASITQGISRAGTSGDTEVYVGGGSYAKFNVVAGISVRGGYGQNWQRGLLATGSSTATVNASFDASIGGPVAIVASGISTSTGISDLTVQGTTAGTGQSSYGVIVRNSTSALTLDTIAINGGTAGSGSAGGNGTSASQSNAAGGSVGGGGSEPGGACNDSTAGAGGGAPSGAGAGGKGGTVDTDCGLFSLDLDAQPGHGGTSAGGAGGAGGSEETTALLCGGGAIQTNGAGGGTGGTGANGSNGGGGAAALGSINVSGVWAASAGAAGSSGAVGADGTGGGGGGGGGASDCNIDDAGAGGGGGGAGGVKAPSAGGGGTAGAASIALLLDNASPTLIGVQITLGHGGNGGTGGAAGLGQPGGNGGAGGAGYERGGSGGAGGNGGKGGNSGAGGGGAGGPAIGLARHNGSTPTGTPTFSGGVGGSGGSGGNTGATGTVVNNAAI